MWPHAAQLRRCTHQPCGIGRVAVRTPVAAGWHRDVDALWYVVAGHRFPDLARARRRQSHPRTKSSTDAVRPASTTSERSTRRRQPAADVRADVPADHGTPCQQGDREPVEVGEEEEDDRRHDVRGHHGERLEGVDDAQVDVETEAEDGHHHHAGAGAEVAAVHPGQGRPGGRERRHLHPVGCVRAVAGTQPAADPRLDADEDAGRPGSATAPPPRRPPAGAPAGATRPATAPTAQVTSTTVVTAGCSRSSRR